MIDYKSYFEKAKEELKTILQQQANALTKQEKKIQQLFEKYPFLLTGTISGIESSYNIFSNIIISQPEFKSYNGNRSPDFLVITCNSLNFFFNFIELEDPSKKIFLKNEQRPSIEFMQAFNQLIQWEIMGHEVKDYCKHLLNTLFEGNFNNTTDKMLHYNYILVYGFSEEIKKLGEVHNRILQTYHAHPRLHHSTYSRVFDNIRFVYPFFSVRKDSSLNKFKAIGYTPFRNYGTDQWSDFHNIVGKQELIRQCSYLTNKEKEKLINDINHMDSKSRKEITGIVLGNLGKSFGDLELP